MTEEKKSEGKMNKSTKRIDWQDVPIQPWAAFPYWQYYKVVQMAAWEQVWKGVTTRTQYVARLVPVDHHGSDHHGIKRRAHFKEATAIRILQGWALGDVIFVNKETVPRKRSRATCAAYSRDHGQPPCDLWVRHRIEIR